MYPANNDSMVDDVVAPALLVGRTVALIDGPTALLVPPLGGNTGKSLTRGMANDSVRTGVKLSHSIRVPATEEGPLTDKSEETVVVTEKIVKEVGAYTALGDIKAVGKG